MRTIILALALLALAATPAHADSTVCVHVRNPNPPPWIEYGECPPDDPNCPNVTVYGEEVLRVCVGR